MDFTVSGGGNLCLRQQQTPSWPARTTVSTFVNWTLNGSVVSTSPAYSSILTGNETLVANFIPIIYTITVNASPTNGGTVSGGGPFCVNGSTNTVMAAATNGYSLCQLDRVNGSLISTSSNYTFIVNGNFTLTANFVPPSYTVTVTASPGADGTVTGGGTFPLGTVVTNTAAPNPGCLFSNCTANGSVVSTSTTYIFTVTNNVALAANFTSNHFDFAYTTNNGSVTIIGYSVARAAT